MSNKKKDQPSIDPYDVLGIEFGATDGEISKAYKKLALKLHPDKQKSDLTESQRDGIAKQFQNIQDARAFLLEVENSEARRKYDRDRQSALQRKKADAEREKTMSINRKRMRDQLKEKERLAKQQRESSSATSSTNRKKVKLSKQQQKDQELVDQLRQRGKKLREEKIQREQDKELERQLKADRRSAKDNLEDRQIRLKWDRKKIKISPSEDSIATQFGEKFGPVERVELLGSKGNQALVTFVDSKSCRPCVDEYATSVEMRAKFVGKRKEREEAMEEERDRAREDNNRRSKNNPNESLHERQLRQAAEREALLRQMEQEDQDGEGGGGQHNQNDSKRASKAAARSKNIKMSPFPLPFPDSYEDEEGNKEYQKCGTPLAKLEFFEKKILGSILSQQELRGMQVIR